MFLKYQFTICVDKSIPMSHLLPLITLTWVFDSLYYITLYWVSIIFILVTLYLAEKYPSKFGGRYLDFLKRNSSSDAFNQYCGNPWSALKAAIKNPEFIKVAFENGVGKGIVGTGGVLLGEHALHKAKLGQIYEYSVEKSMNSGVHPSGKPFLYKPNGPSILEQLVKHK